MKTNHKGFTLIESVISFAILAIAGTMFLLGFYNVATIASEGSLIKTETNTLYNQLITRTDVITDTNYRNMTLTIQGEDTPINIEVQGVSTFKNIGDDSFDIRLNAFDPKLKAEKLPDVLIDDGIEDVDPKDCNNATFKVIDDLSQFPETYEELKLYEKEDSNHFKTIQIIDNSVNPKVETNLFGEHVGRYIIDSPTVDAINKFVKDSPWDFIGEYKTWLYDGAEVRWMCIDATSHSIGSNGKKNVTVYGYLQKNNTRSLVLHGNLDNIRSMTKYYDISDKTTLDIDKTLGDLIVNKKFKIDNDNSIYTGADIINLKFAKDNSKKIYIAKEITE